MVADGDGAFAKATGLELDLQGKGLGLRNQRFSMLVDDGTVRILNIDPAGSFEKPAPRRYYRKSRSRNEPPCPRRANIPPNAQRLRRQGSPIRLS